MSEILLSTYLISQAVHSQILLAVFFASKYMFILSLASRMRIFSRDDGSCKLWSNGNNPQTTTIAKHLGTHPKWAEKCTTAGITQKQAPTKAYLESVQDEPFTVEGLVHYLTRWIAVDDQVCLFFIQFSVIYADMIWLSQSISSRALSFESFFSTADAKSKTRISHGEPRQRRP
jgi:hypothetical protein